MFLLQMSKTWQSASRRPQQWNVRRERYAASTEWSTGKKLGEDVPAEEVSRGRTGEHYTNRCLWGTHYGIRGRVHG